MSQQQTDSLVGITIAEPSSAVARRAARGTYNWSVLADTIDGVAPATWVRVDLATLPGPTVVLKQTAVHNNLGRRIGKLQTVTEDGYIFIRRA